MVDDNGNDKKYAWWRTINLTNLIWFVIVAIIGWAVWTTRRSDALERTAADNCKRITVVEGSIPIIKENLSSINTNIEWIKKNIK